jgi:membrane associated rhomboid family serine protease
VPGPSSRLLNRSITFFGARFPFVSFLLAASTLAASILGAVMKQLGWEIHALMALVPARVWSGEVWRLLTWPFFAPDPISLFFACLIILFFGRDLSYQWGPLRFLRVYLGFGLGVGAAICVLAWVWPAIRQAPYLTPWPLADALIIAWATWFPSRQLLVYFVLPLGGRKLIYATWGINVLFALYYGLAPFVPHFLAMGGMWLYLNGGGLGGWWGRLRGGGWGKGGTRRRSNLRVIDPRERRDEPPRWLH